MTDTRYITHDHSRTLLGIAYFAIDLWDIDPADLDTDSFTNWPHIEPWRVKHKAWAEASDLKRANYLLHRANAVLAEDGGRYFLAPTPTPDAQNT